MNRIIKFSNLLAIAGLLLFAPVSNAATAAQTSTKAQSQVDPQTQKNFCNAFLGDSQKFLQGISAQVTSLENRISKESSKIQADRQDNDSKVKQQQANAAAERQTIYAKLSAKAGTDQQKQAVSDFKNAMEAAAANRDSALKTAQNNFRQAFDRLMVQHQNAVRQVLVNFQNAIQAAVQQAKTSCAAGTRPAAVKQNFQVTLDAARRARNSGTQSIDRVGPQIADLARNRNMAVRQAMLNYQTAIQAAIAKLKAAFPADKGTDNSTKPK